MVSPFLRVRSRKAIGLGLLLLQSVLAWGQPSSNDSRISAGNARFTVITPECIRLEYSPSGQFIDEPSLFAQNREARDTEARIETSASGETVITTSRMRLTFQNDGKPFHDGNLSIRVSDSSGTPTVWKPSSRQLKNLHGTLISLDDVLRSITPIDENLSREPKWTVADDPDYTERTSTVADGILSKDGWFLLDDSSRMLLADDQSWAHPRPTSRNGSNTDWYFFGYGDDYKGALASLTAIGGSVPLPRRSVLGAWYSRYWPYTADDYREIVAEFHQHEFPLDMVVLDMDWHAHKEPHSEDDYWSGYTWNKKLFPDPAGFLEEIHRDGLHVTLNDHPVDGVQPWEENYGDFARSIGKDPGSGAKYPFDGSDPDYVAAFFKFMIDPNEKIGADFWWVDWPGEPGEPFNRLAWVNELYYRHSLEGGLRGQQFSRYGGWGDHRHPIHFSGDVNMKWSALKLEVPFTATSGNAGVFYWSHDIGGFKGVRNPELYARWTQFGAFSAALRLHSTREANLDKRPWKYQPPIEDSLKKSFQLRSEFFPYTYSLAWQAHSESLPLLRPLYLELPQAAEAYQNPQEYLYGEDILVAPITRPGDSSGQATQHVWFPPGRWYHWFGHEAFDGPLKRDFREGLDSFPLFVRGGVPIPLQPTTERMTEKVPDTLRILVFPGEQETVGRFTLYEDDGSSLDYLKGAGNRTVLEFKESAHEATLSIKPGGGAFEGKPRARGYVIELPEFPEIGDLEVRVGGELLEPTAYARSAHSLTVPSVDSNDDVTARVRF